MKELNALDWIVIILILIGGLNWGVLGLFNVNVIGLIFGEMTTITRIIYTLVGVAAVYLAILSMSLSKKE